MHVRCQYVTRAGGGTPICLLSRTPIMLDALQYIGSHTIPWTMGEPYEYAMQAALVFVVCIAVADGIISVRA